MLNITYYQRNANQNYNDVSPHTGENGHHQKNLQTINAGELVEKREPSLYSLQECKLIQPLWRTVWSFLKKLGIKLPYDPTILLLVLYPEKTIILKYTCTPIFVAELFTIARTWKQLRRPLTDKLSLYFYNLLIYICCHFDQQLKEAYIFTCVCLAFSLGLPWWLRW